MAAELRGQRSERLSERLDPIRAESKSELHSTYSTVSVSLPFMRAAVAPSVLTTVLQLALLLHRQMGLPAPPQLNLRELLHSAVRVCRSSDLVAAASTCPTRPERLNVLGAYQPPRRHRAIIGRVTLVCTSAAVWFDLSSDGKGWGVLPTCAFRPTLNCLCATISVGTSWVRPQGSSVALRKQQHREPTEGYEEECYQDGHGS